MTSELQVMYFATVVGCHQLVKSSKNIDDSLWRTAHSDKCSVQFDALEHAFLALCNNVFDSHEDTEAASDGPTHIE